MTQIYSLQNAIDEVRRVLQDYEAVRYSDTEVVRAINAALSELRRQRPDLRASRALATNADFPYAVGDEAKLLPIHLMFWNPVITYACTWLELADAEFANNGRLATLFTSLKDGMMGR